jgi:hypothetical protein
MASKLRASRPLSLSHLTIGEVLPPDVPAVAAATGFDSISLRLNSPRSPLAVLIDFGGVIVDPWQEDAASRVRVQEYVSPDTAAARAAATSRTSSARCLAHTGARQHAQ